MTELLHSGEFYASSCALVWACAFILFRKAGEHVPPVVLNLFKNTVGFTLLLATMLVLGVPILPEQRSLVDWLTLLASGFIGIAIADSLVFASLNRLGAGRSAIVDCLYSPFIILCAAIYLGEAVQGMVFLAMALVVGAILVGTWEPGGGSAPENKRELLLGVVYGALSMFFMAVAVVLAKPVLELSDVWWATWVRMAGAFPLLLVQAGARRYRGEVLKAFRPGPHWKSMLPAAFLGTYVALVLWMAGFKYSYATTASILNQTSTLMVLVLATIFLGERLSVRKVLAIGAGFGAAVLVITQAG